MRSLVLLALLLGSACAEPSPVPPPSAVSESAPRLSLRAPGEARPIDAEISGLQAKLARQPNEAGLWELLARAWVKKAREAQRPALYAHAQDAAAAALALEPNRPGALEVKALVFQSEHRFRELSTLALSMTTRDPTRADAWALLGDAQLELGEYEAAAASYQRMIDLQPGLPAFSRVAYLRFLEGDLAGAREMWAEAIAVGFSKNPEQLAFCLVEDGHLLWMQGQLSPARARYEEALSLLPNYAGALFGRGRVHMAQGDSSSARADFVAATAARPSVEIYRWLAAASRSVGDEAAAAEAEAAAEIEGRTGDFRTLSLLYSSSSRDSATALRLAEEDAAQRGGIYTQDALALALWRSGRLEEAQRAITQALAHRTPDPLLLAHAGLIAATRGDATAVPLLESALALNPWFDPVLPREVRDTLARLAQ